MLCAAPTTAKKSANTSSSSTRTGKQLDSRYARKELGLDIYRRDPGMKVHRAVIAAPRTHCSIQGGVAYATEWGREYARREVTHILREHGFEVDSSVNGRCRKQQNS
jgi:hypothetical protein